MTTPHRVGFQTVYFQIPNYPRSRSHYSSSSASPRCIAGQGVGVQVLKLVFLSCLYRYILSDRSS